MTDVDIPKTLQQALFEEEARPITLSGISSYPSVVSLRLARAIAELIVMEKGEIDVRHIPQIIRWLERQCLLLTQHGEQLVDRLQHLVKSLEFLGASKEARDTIKRITKPHANRLSESIIRDTLEMGKDAQIADKDARKSAVIALCTMLRQSLGSCFATAPSILIQKESPLRLLKDIETLLATGILNKTVRGTEYNVPMSRTWGMGDLQKPFIFSVSGGVLEWEEGSNLPASPILLHAFKEAGIAISSEEITRFFFAELREKVPHGDRKKTFEMAPAALPLEKIIEIISLRFHGFSLKDAPQKVAVAKGIVFKGIDPTSSFLSREEKLAPKTSKKSNGHKERERVKAVENALAIAENVKLRLRMKNDCALLKAWEFTIASYAEVQFELCHWNFYSSLGVNWNDEGGIGQILYQIAQECVEETKHELEEIEKKFDLLNIEILNFEQRARQASSEHEMSWIKMELQSRKTEQYHLQQLANQMTAKTNKIINIHKFLIDEYDTLFKEYFQEIYDADLHDVDVGPFDDAPAGFRLIYKHGRSNPALWTPIYSLDEYIDSLASFFSLTEQQLSIKPEINGIEKEFGRIITKVITHIRSPLFQESALNRTLKAHGMHPIQDPIQHIEALEKKPWVFTSGGSMESLVRSYFKLEEKADTSARWVENETELLAFLIDTTRLSENRLRMSLYRNRTSAKIEAPRSLLMHSPTHAFRLLPEAPLFHSAWTSDMYSYSWIYNTLRDPCQELLKQTLLPNDILERALLDLVGLFPKKAQKRAREVFQVELSPFQRIFDCVNTARKACRLDKELQKYEASVFGSGVVDEMIYRSFPYHNEASAREVLQKGLAHMLNIFSKRTPETLIEETIRAVYDKEKRMIVSAEELKLLFLQCIRSILGSSTHPQCTLLKEAVGYLRSVKAIFPEPVIVADSNWVNEYFAFVVSPISLEIEFWMVSFFGTTGKPMPSWKKWLNGSDTTKTWGVLVNPLQYRAE